jgi:hypothetical protein
LRTSDFDKPNCRAIREGVTPALNAARTAFTWPRVNATAATPIFCLYIGPPDGLACSGIGRDEAPGVLVGGATVVGIGLPRRLAS